jgi:hypothetical protein
LVEWEIEMAEQSIQWEYRVLTIGSVFGTKDENVEATLNEWGLEGWEAIHVYTPSQSSKVYHRCKTTPDRRIPPDTFHAVKN